MSAFDPTVVDLMRAPVGELRHDPSNALRLTLRLGGGYMAIMSQLRRFLAVNANEFDALMSLWDGGRCSMSDLSRRTGVSRAAVTTLTDRLEKKGLVIRETAPDDRRRVLLTVTPKFETELMEAAAVMDEPLGKLRARPEWEAHAQLGADLRRELRDASKLLSQVDPEAARRGGPPRMTAEPQQWW